MDRRVRNSGEAVRLLDATAWLHDLEAAQREAVRSSPFGTLYRLRPEMDTVRLVGLVVDDHGTITARVVSASGDRQLHRPAQEADRIVDTAMLDELEPIPSLPGSHS
jgi:hypothetical protein